MRLLFNHSIFSNLQTIGLVFVLSISPIQSISASTSNCMDMENSMHHEMNITSQNNHHNMHTIDNSDDCCNKNKCESSHCISTTTAFISSNSTFYITTTDSSIYQIPDISLTHFYPSSLYRPPKL